MDIPSRPMYEIMYDSHDAVCPYCRDRYQVETADYSEDSRKIECDGCGRKYWLQQNFQVTHKTTPDCIINGLEHQSERVVLSSGREADFCKICDKCLKTYPKQEREGSMTKNEIARKIADILLNAPASIVSTTIRATPAEYVATIVKMWNLVNKYERASE